MPTSRKRPPVVAGVLLVVAMVLSVRSVWVSDAVRWQSVDDQSQSLIKRSFGIRTGRLGIGLFHEEAIIPSRSASQVNEALSSLSPGLSYGVETLPEHASLARRLGFGFDHVLDERPESFKNHLALSVPIWLLAIPLAIGPLRWLVARRRAAAAGRQSDDATDAADVPARRSNMRTTIIALVAGLLIGAAATWFIARSNTSDDDRATAIAAAVVEDAEPPIHPIVGMWQIRIDPIVTTYQFANDGSFVLTFKSPALPRTPAGGAHDAGGSWRVDGNKLVLTNKWSNTPLTVVGEEETATIVAVDAKTLQLDHAGRKGKTERLTFTRAHAFIKGKIEKPEVMGTWKSPQFRLDLKHGGDVVMTYNSRTVEPRTGAWSQAGEKLTLMMEPPYVKSAARRAADPSLTEPREESYDIYSVDDLRLILHRTDTPMNENIVFRRVGAEAADAGKPVR